MSKLIMYKGRPIDEMARDELLVIIREMVELMEADRKRYRDTIATLSAIYEA